jgi:hypothetical protein
MYIAVRVRRGFNLVGDGQRPVLCVRGHIHMCDGCEVSLH